MAPFPPQLHVGAVLIEESPQDPIKPRHAQPYSALPDVDRASSPLRVRGLRAEAEAQAIDTLKNRDELKHVDFGPKPAEKEPFRDWASSKSPGARRSGTRAVVQRQGAELPGKQRPSFTEATARPPRSRLVSTESTIQACVLAQFIYERFVN